MMYQRFHFLAVLYFLILPLYGSEKKSEYLGPCDLLLGNSGSVLYVLEQDAEQIRKVPIDSLRDTVKDQYLSSSVLPIGFRPERMCFLPGEKRIAIVGGGVQGKLLIVNTNKSFSIDRRIDLHSHTPSDVSAGKDPSGKTTIFVCNRFSETVLAVDPEKGLIRKKWKTGREPYAMKYVPEKGKIIVASLIPDLPADESYTTASVYTIDLKTDEVRRVELLNGASNLKDIAISTDGKYAFITGTLGKFRTVTTQVVGGWIMENILSVVDIERSEAVDTFYLDDTMLGAANPWGVSFSSTLPLIVLTLAGMDELLLMPSDRILKMLNDRPEWNRPGQGAYTYTYQGEGAIKFPLRVRVKMGMKGMRRVLADGDRIFFAASFEDAIGCIRVKLNPPYENHPGAFVKSGDIPKPQDPVFAKKAAETDSASVIRLEPIAPLKGIAVERTMIRLGKRPHWNPQRRGEVVFHDATICMEQWLSCSSCHPDARVDGLNWDLVNDGVGNPKNTKSMLLSHETPPSMISGVRPDAETAVRAGVSHLLFSRIPESDNIAMDEYLRALKPVPSPYLIDGKMSPSAQRGRFLFESSRTNCSVCHPAPLFTDLKLHRIHSQDSYDNITQFDTPTLIEVWRTAPYMNTGHYTTIRSMLFEGKHANADGLLDKLSEQEKTDLINYVLSL
ncbi:MAG: hypothetical protein Q4G69_01615 [Planctomycetia bacterium]|nr:hypothetical protein [Planctomycetia bacterium]